MDGLFVVSKNAYELLGHRLSAKTCFLKKFSYFSKSGLFVWSELVHQLKVAKVKNVAK